MPICDHSFLPSIVSSTGFIPLPTRKVALILFKRRPSHSDLHRRLTPRHLSLRIPISLQEVRFPLSSDEFWESSTSLQQMMAKFVDPEKHPEVPLGLGGMDWVGGWFGKASVSWILYEVLCRKLEVQPGHTYFSQNISKPICERQLDLS